MGKNQLAEGWGGSCVPYLARGWKEVQHPTEPLRLVDSSLLCGSQTAGYLTMHVPPQLERHTHTPSGKMAANARCHPHSRCTLPCLFSEWDRAPAQHSPCRICEHWGWSGGHPDTTGPRFCPGDSALKTITSWRSAFTTKLYNTERMAITEMN